MSYILDAIKKAERQRQVDQMPTLESSIAFQAEAKSTMPWKPVVLVTLGLLIVLVIFWKKEVVTELVGYGNEVVKSLLSLDEAEDTEPAYSEKNQQATEQQISQSAPTVESTTESTEQPTALSPGADNSQSEKLDKEASAISSEEQSALNQIRFSVISYSKDDDKRFVMYGGKIYREGDIVQGYPILSILKNSVVLNVHGNPYETRL